MARSSDKLPPTQQRKRWQHKLQHSAAKKRSGETDLPSVLLDSNVWISAIVHGGNPEQAVDIALSSHKIIASEELIQEVSSSLRDTFRGPHLWVARMRRIIEKICYVPDILPMVKVVRDPKDDHVIAAAMAMGCRLIVTGDQDLLSLEMIEQIEIISVHEFVNHP